MSEKETLKQRSVSIIVFVGYIIIAFSLENAVSGESWLKPLVNMWKFILDHIFGITIFFGIITVIGLNLWWYWKSYKQRIREEFKEEVKNLELLKSDKIIEAINSNNDLTKTIACNLDPLIRINSKNFKKYDEIFLEMKTDMLKYLRKDEHSRDNK